MEKERFQELCQKSKWDVLRNGSQMPKVQEGIHKSETLASSQNEMPGQKQEGQLTLVSSSTQMQGSSSSSSWNSTSVTKRHGVSLQ
jgi:hypothetical protein